MAWLRRLLGYRGTEYVGADFTVRLDHGFREIVSIVRTREGAVTTLDAELIGSRWQGIAVHFPAELPPIEVTQLVSELTTAFEALRYGYVISRTAAVESVSESEQEAAIAELMGFEVELFPDPQQIALRPIPGFPRPSTRAIREATPRMISLLHAARGKRIRIDVLAKSKDFA